MPAPTKPGKRSGKRAVVIIHGIGNQAPMVTLRSFVDSVWTTDDRLTKHGTRQAWSKPERVSNNLELRRITTTEDQTRRRTDFFEFYWAHMMEDTKFSSVLWWIKRLLVRGSGRVPPDLVVPWLAGIASLILLFALVVCIGLAILKTFQILPVSLFCAALWLGVAGAMWAFLWYLRHRVIVEVVGDAAAYLTASPQNIGARSRIRMAGLQLLDALHDNSEYDRVILVCHSLGTVIGYDLLTFFWSNNSQSFVHETAEGKGSLRNVEALAKAVRENPAGGGAAPFGEFRDAQRDYARNVSMPGGRAWKITDFVTLGSPLAHAHLLLVNDNVKLGKSEIDRAKKSWIRTWYTRLDEKTRTVAAVLAARIAERSFPACPPEPEKGPAFSYERKDLRGKPLSPNHAAVFGAVRWTNIFAPRRCLLWGDMIAGPVGPLFGPGVKDVQLSGAMSRSWIAHVNYWELEKFSTDKKHIEALRAAVNLLDENEKTAWDRSPKKAEPAQGGTVPAP
jgi:hypothetical protein